MVSKVVLLLVLCAIGVVLAAKSKTKTAGTTCSSFTSAELLFNMGPLSSSTVSPTPTNCFVGSCDMYIWGTWFTKLITGAQTCLGWNGVLSSVGPLAALGPVGSNNWSPADVMNFVGNWEDYKTSVMGGIGPLEHPKGPMSNAGPLGEAFFTTMPKINDFTLHMQGQGIWSVLGPLGPLGPLGILGPLGVVGSHGFGQTDEGDYVDTAGSIQRKVEAAWDENTKITWPLFEKYTAERAASLGNNQDTSFLVKGSTSSSVTFRAVSKEKQYVTIVAVPEKYGQIFSVQVKNPAGTVVASSSSLYMINWIQLYIPTDNVTVPLDITISPLMPDVGASGYYLYVVGSTRTMLREPHIAFKGDYISKCDA